MRKWLAKWLAISAAGLMLAGCQKSDVRLTVLIGETTVPESGAHPIDDSVIVIASEKVRAVGMRKDVPIPQNSDRVDFTGRWIVPAEGARIAPGETANLIVLSHAPNGVAPANPADVTSRMSAGQWVK